MVNIMKYQVRFDVKDIIIVEYDRQKLITELRRWVAESLMKHCERSIESDLLASQFSSTKEYVSVILRYALVTKASHRKLEKIKELDTKLPFLSSTSTSENRDITNISYRLMALVNGDLEAIRSRIEIVHKEGAFPLYPKGVGYVGEESTDALCRDVSNLTKKCIRKFLQELRKTGFVMTSDELTDHTASLVASLTETETSYSDDEFEEYVEEDSGGSTQPTNDSESKEASTSTSGDSSKSSQRSITPDVEFDSEKPEQNNDNDKTATEDRSSSKYDNNYFLILEKFFAWIYELPEWLQKQILNSAPIKAMIEAAEQMTAIYDHKLIEIEFANKKLEADFTFNDSDVLLTHNMYGKIEIHNTSLSNPFDLDMILEKNGVKYDILPIDMGINIASGMGNIPVLELNGVGSMIHGVMI